MLKLQVTNPEEFQSLPANQILQLYNALDCAITAQLWNKLYPEMSCATRATYARTLRVQQLCFAMSLEGFPIDHDEVTFFRSHLTSELNALDKIWQKLCEAVGLNKVNWNSGQQLLQLFELFAIKPRMKFNPKTSTSSPTVDRKSLEEYYSGFSTAAPFVHVVLSMRDRAKMLSTFKRGFDPDGKMRCSFLPAGTETGRLASRQNIFHRGTNAQNITPRARTVVVAPPGYQLLVFDLEQAESRAVAYISGDENYIAACEGPDLHTYTARLVWPDLGWTGDASKDRAIADRPFYRTFSYRDVSKRGGHATNYYGKAREIASRIMVPAPLVEKFQESYFRAFPGIERWQNWVIARVQQDRRLTTPTGRQRCFWGRPTDRATWREAIAYGPQSLVADIMNEGLWNVGQWLRGASIDARLLAQIHDAGVMLIRERDADWLVPEIISRATYPIEITGLDGKTRTLTIPFEAKTGWNWGYANDSNPGGLMKWKKGEKRERPAARNLLDRSF